MANLKEETKLVCVVEKWKLYPKEYEKTEKNNKMDGVEQNI